LVLAGLAAAGFAACRPDRLIEDPEPSHGGNVRAEPSGEGAGHHRRRGQAAVRAPEHPAPTATATATAEAPLPAGVAGSVHLTMGVPSGGDAANDYLLVRSQYALSYSKERHVPSWVSWEINASWYGSAPRKKGKFLTDETLPPGYYRVEDRDYSGSGYDRGHMVRSEERTRSVEDNVATFFLTNVLPQTHELNAGPWLRLEDYCEALAKREDKEMFVTAGGIFSQNPPTIGKGVAVPDACFKIVVVLDRGQGLADVKADTRVIAVIMPNKAGILDEAWGQYRTSVADVEQRTGYRFLTAVPAPVRAALEQKVDNGPTNGR
jgi:endonuclease G, mitochondrial